jgi:hypothetical protein
VNQLIYQIASFFGFYLIAALCVVLYQKISESQLNKKIEELEDNFSMLLKVVNELFLKNKDLQNRHDDLARQIFFIMWHSKTGNGEERLGHLYEEHLKNKKEKINNE